MSATLALGLTLSVCADSRKTPTTDRAVADICRTPDAFHNPGGYDSPAAKWIEGLLTDAGYSITGNSGAAWYACSRTGEFLISAGSAPENSNPGAEVLTVEEITVFGSTEFNGYYWSAQGLTIRISQGPFADSRLPSVDELEALVRASARTPFKSST